MARTSSTWREFFARLLLAGMGLAIACAALEAALRLSSPWFDPPDQETVQQTPPRTGGSESRPQLPELRTISDLTRPNALGLHNGKLFRTNSTGFRGREVARMPPPHTFRIAVIGDSVTMGSGVAEEETYPARLQARLNAESSSLLYEVLNLGVSGFNLDDEIRRLVDIGLAFQPDLVVYGFTVNDVEGPAFRESGTPALRRANRERWGRFDDSPSYLLRALWPRLLALRHLLLVPRGTYIYDLHQNYTEEAEAWIHFQADLDRLARIGAERGLCVQVLIHTAMLHLKWLHPFRCFYDAVEDAARKRGLAVTQSFPYFRGRDSRALRVSKLDPHPNGRAHALLAQALYDGLRSLPPACWAPRRGRIFPDQSSSR